MSLHSLGITPGETRLVLEVGNCAGSLEWAMEAVDAAAGHAWGIKAQFYSRDTLTTRTAPTYGHEFLEEPETQWDNFEQQLSWDQWREVSDYARERGLVFFASVFDEQSAFQAYELNCELVKIASADITHKPLLQYVANSGVPIVLSTGGATLAEIGDAYRWIHEIDDKLEVLPLICTLCYPTPSSEAHLARIGWWQENVGPLVGYSDHTEGISAMLTARFEGAVMIEKHFTVTPGKGGDHNFALSPGQLGHYSEVINRKRDLFEPGPNWLSEGGDPQPGPRPVELPAIQNARRSVAAAVDIAKGTPYTFDMFTYLRPGTGYPPATAEQLVGSLAPVDIQAGDLIPFSPQPGVTSGRATINASLTVE